MVKTAKLARHDHDLRFGHAEHEGQLAVAEDRHHRVGHRADAQAGQVQCHKLPPVGQLVRHHVATLHAQCRQTKRDAPGQAQHLPVRQGGRLPGHAVEVGHGHFVEAAGRDFVQKIEQGLVVPVSAGLGLLNQFGAQLRFDHVVWSLY